MLAVGDNWANHEDQKIAFWGTIQQILGEVEKKIHLPNMGKLLCVCFESWVVQLVQKNVAWKLLIVDYFPGLHYRRLWVYPCTLKF